MSLSSTQKILQRDQPSLPYPEHKGKSHRISVFLLCSNVHRKTGVDLNQRGYHLTTYTISPRLFSWEVPRGHPKSYPAYMSMFARLVCADSTVHCSTRKLAWVIMHKT